MPINAKTCTCKCRANKDTNNLSPTILASPDEGTYIAEKPKVGRGPKVAYAGRTLTQNASTQNKDAPRGDIND